MRKVLKYITAAILAVWLSCLSAISAFAYTEGYFRYEITDGVLIITEYFGREENVTVPNMIAGTPVSVIGENVFSEGCGVKTVNLPDTIMKIHENSFGSGVNVVYATIPEQTTPPDNIPPASETEIPSHTDTTDVEITHTEETANGDDSDQTAPNIGEGGMEESENGADAVLDMTDIPDYIEIIPAKDTSEKESAETTPPKAVTTIQPADSAVADDNTGEQVSTDADVKTVVPDEKGGQVKEEDNDVSEQKSSNITTIVICIGGIAAVIAVAAVILVRRKK